MSRRLQVFLSYASDDEEVVRKLYERLLSEGFIDPWLDKEKLLPGDDWRHEIEAAGQKSDVVLVCLSSRSINKRGEIESELYYFLELAKNKPQGTIFLIPVKLEPCDTPLNLRRWTWADLFKDAEYQRLLRSFHKRATELGIRVSTSPKQSQETPESTFTPLDKTMSNPRYDSDTKCLERYNYELSSIVRAETIILVVGCWVGAELCDRPVAEMIRDEIDKRGKENPYRRGVVVTDAEWSRNAPLRSCPAIAVGGPSANSLTSELDKKAAEDSRWRLGRTVRVFSSGPPPKIALWGDGVHETSVCVEAFLKEPGVLDRFLEMCWK